MKTRETIKRGPNINTFLRTATKLALLYVSRVLYTLSKDPFYRDDGHFSECINGE